MQVTAKATNATSISSVAFVASLPPDKANTERAPEVHLQLVKPLRLLSPPVDTQADNDRACWPHSKAMNSQEIDTFIVRLEQFMRKGVSLANAEALADQLVLRDREEDDRQLCLECQYLQGDVGRWRCANAQRAGMAVGTANAPLPAGLIQQLQRCPGLIPIPTAITAVIPF